MFSWYSNCEAYETDEAQLVPPSSCTILHLGQQNSPICVVHIYIYIYIYLKRLATLVAGLANMSIIIMTYPHPTDVRVFRSMACFLPPKRASTSNGLRDRITC